MKKSLLLIPFMTLFMLPLNFIYPKDKSVLDYYNMIPSNLLGGIKYKIFNRDKKFYTISDVNIEVPVIIDFKNGYLSLEDCGTGGGSLKQELAIFINNKKEHYLAVNIVRFDGAAWDGTCDVFFIMMINLLT